MCGCLFVAICSRGREAARVRLWRGPRRRRRQRQPPAHSRDPHAAPGPVWPHPDALSAAAAVPGCQEGKAELPGAPAASSRAGLPASARQEPQRPRGARGNLPGKKKRLSFPQLPSPLSASSSLPLPSFPVGPTLCLPQLPLPLQCPSDTILPPLPPPHAPPLLSQSLAGQLEALKPKARRGAAVAAAPLHQQQVKALPTSSPADTSPDWGCSCLTSSAEPEGNPHP